MDDERTLLSQIDLIRDEFARKSDDYHKNKISRTVKKYAVLQERGVTNNYNKFATEFVNNAKEMDGETANAINDNYSDWLAK